MRWGLRSTAVPHDLIDVPGELGVGHAQSILAIFVDGLDWPTGVELSGNLGEVCNECDAANALHALPVRWWAHPVLRMLAQVAV